MNTASENLEKHTDFVLFFFGSIISTSQSEAIELEKTIQLQVWDTKMENPENI